ncbi:MAG: hypothetical protein AAF939_21670, partial [Planctomycetota bacterium]
DGSQRHRPNSRGEGGPVFNGQFVLKSKHVHESVFDGSFVLRSKISYTEKWENCPVSSIKSNLL